MTLGNARPVARIVPASRIFVMNSRRLDLKFMSLVQFLTDAQQVSSTDCSVSVDSDRSLRLNEFLHHVPPRRPAPIGARLTARLGRPGHGLRRFGLVILGQTAPLV